MKTKILTAIVMGIGLLSPQAIFAQTPEQKAKGILIMEEDKDSYSVAVTWGEGKGTIFTAPKSMSYICTKMDSGAVVCKTIKFPLDKTP